MEEDYQRALEPSFTYGCRCCVFKRNIWGDQLEGQDCMPDSPDLLSPKCFTGLRCSPILASFEGAAAKDHRREVAEEFGRGATLGHSNEHQIFFLWS